MASSSYKKQSNTEVKRRKNRPGTVAFRKHLRLNKEKNLDKYIFPKATIQRVAKEILNAEIDNEEDKYRISREALDEIRNKVENFALKVAYNGRLILENGKRSTLYEKDVNLALRMSYPNICDKVCKGELKQPLNTV